MENIENDMQGGWVPWWEVRNEGSVCAEGIIRFGLLTAEWGCF